MSFESRANWSGMPLNTYKTHRLFNFIPMNGKEQGYDEALKFVGDRGPLRKHHFITFAGEVGRGKTHLALGIGWHWLDNNLGLVRYWQVQRLLDAQRDHIQIEERLKRDLGAIIPTSPKDWCEKCDLLILDDLGTEKLTEWAEVTIGSLIDFRYINDKLTVFTTNIGPEGLPPRVQSRLMEGVTVTIKGIDYRSLKKQAPERIK